MNPRKENPVNHRTPYPARRTAAATWAAAVLALLLGIRGHMTAGLTAFALLALVAFGAWGVSLDREDHR